MNSLKQVHAVLAVTLFGALAAQSSLACTTPKAPSAIPDGRTARIEVMLEARRNVESYFQHVSAYMNCEKDALKLQEASERQTEILKWFNAEVRAFKATNTPMMAATYR